MNKPSSTPSDEVLSEFALKIAKAGLMPVDQAQATCRFVGLELQGIPKQYRELAVARLRNKAEALRNEGVPEDMVKLIDAVCDGWTDFSVK
ncbi:hypothetical protein [Paracidovorax wautersii]|uniref:hypothetical protein n=1 Tax=Paracidovorax wautersii TaxID=1177982 RepID=UPI0031D209FF